MTATMFDTPSELLEDAAALLLDAAKHLRRLPHEPYGRNLDEDEDFSTDVVLSAPAWPDEALWVMMNRARQAAKIAEYMTHLRSL